MESGGEQSQVSGTCMDGVIGVVRNPSQPNQPQPLLLPPTSISYLTGKQEGNTIMHESGAAPELSILPMN